MNPYESPQTKPVPSLDRWFTFYGGFVCGVSFVVGVMAVLQALRAFGWI